MCGARSRYRVPSMEIRSLADAEPFETKDGSTIRLLLDSLNAPVRHQSLAEATVPAGGSTERHYHRESEELYYLIEGRGEMEVEGDRSAVRPGDAILIPPGSWHQLTASDEGRLRLLCCCAPPYRDADTYFE